MVMGQLRLEDVETGENLLSRSSPRVRSNYLRSAARLMIDSLLGFWLAEAINRLPSRLGRAGNCNPFPHGWTCVQHDQAQTTIDLL